MPQFYKQFWWLTLAGMMVAAGWMILLMTRQGIGLFADDLVYFEIARTFDVFNHTTHPPLYGIVLGLLGGLLGTEPERSAIILNILLMPLNLFVLVLMIRLLRPNRPWMSLAAGGMVLFSYPYLYVHALAASEPLFIILVNLSLLMLTIITSKTFRWVGLVGAAVFASFALATRYAGFALVIYSIMILLWNPAKSTWVRLSRAGAYGLISTIPLTVIFFVRGIQKTGGSLTSRSVDAAQLVDNLNRIATIKIPQYFVTFVEWFLPYRVAALIRIELTAILLIMVVFGVLLFNCLKPKKTDGLSISCLTFWPPFYLLFVMGWMFISGEAEIALDHRILSPMSVWIVPLFFVSACDVLGLRPYARAILIILFSGMFSVSICKSLSLLRRTSYQGLAMGALSWRQSETLRNAISIAQRETLYSNAEELFLLYYPEIPVRALPHKLMYYTGKPNPNFSSQMDKLRMDIEQRNARIVIFTSPYATDADIPPYRLAPSIIKELLNLDILETFSDGYIMGRKRN